MSCVQWDSVMDTMRGGVQWGSLLDGTCAWGYSYKLMQGYCQVWQQVHPVSYVQWCVSGEDALAEVVDASDMNSIAGVLKLYFRELREPLFPLHLFDALVECTRRCSGWFSHPLFSLFLLFVLFFYTSFTCVYFYRKKDRKDGKWHFRKMIAVVLTMIHLHVCMLRDGEYSSKKRSHPKNKFKEKWRRWMMGQHIKSFQISGILYLFLLWYRWEWCSETTGENQGSTGNFASLNICCHALSFCLPKSVSWDKFCHSNTCLGQVLSSTSSCTFNNGIIFTNMNMSRVFVTIRLLWFSTFSTI